MADPQVDQLTAVTKEALARGYHPEDVAAGLRGAGWPEDLVMKAVRPPPDSFGEESGLPGLSKLPGIFGDAYNHLQDVVAGSANPRGRSLWDGLLHPMLAAQTADTASQVAQGNAAMKRGDISNALGDYAEGVPFVGHPVTHLVGNLHEGNWGGAAGDALALAGPDLFRGIIGKAGKLSGSAAERIYRRVLPFDVFQYSRPDIEDAVRTGIKEGLPADKLFSPESKSSAARIGSIDDPATLLGKDEAALRPWVTGANGARELNPAHVLGPFVDHLKSFLRAPTETGQNMVTTMLREAAPALREISPALKWVIDDSGAPAAQQVAWIEKWMNNPNGVHTNLPVPLGQSGTNPLASSMTVARAHEASRAINKVISESNYRDVNGNVIPGVAQANLSLRQGLKEGINSIHPDVARINNHMHDLITLKNTMDSVGKAAPRDAEHMMKAILGATAMIGGGAEIAGLLGHFGAIPMSVGATAGLALNRVLESPRAATLLGITMGKAPAAADAVAQFSRGVPNVLPATRSLSGDPNNPLQKLLTSVSQYYVKPK